MSVKFISILNNYLHAKACCVSLIKVDQRLLNKEESKCSIFSKISKERQCVLRIALLPAVRSQQ